MRRTFNCVLGAFGLVLLAHAQAPPAFEVGSVKASTTGGGVRGGCHGVNSRYGPTEAPSAPPLGRCVVTNGRLGHLIRIAYGLGPNQPIKGGPDWVAMGDARFNIEAKAEDPTKATEQQLLQMLQALLVERFQLKFHRETVERPGFALVVAKNGPKLKEAKGEEAVTVFGGEAQSKPMPGQAISLNARKYSMAMLAEMLSALGPAPVIDKTGLPGDYDFTLAWDDSSSPSLSTALNEQLGLRLESQKVPVALFVIDSAQKPTGN